MAIPSILPSALQRVTACGRWLLALVVAVGVLSHPVASAVAQHRKLSEKKAAEKKAPEKKTTEKATSSGDDEIPPPEEVTLITDDGLELVLTYYRGLKGKESIPVVLLHAMRGSSKDFTKEGGIAEYLRTKLGCAVIVPDLRGHGNSTKITVGKKTDKITAARLPPSQMGKMVLVDMVALKDWLWKKNNQQELNLNKLCLVGVEMGASVAINFAAIDAKGYDQPAPFVGPVQLGRFVRTMVLISPDSTVPGLPTRDALAMPVVRSNIAVMILVGKDNPKALKEAEGFHRLFEKGHLGPDESSRETRTLWYGPLETKLQGAKLLDEVSLNVPKHVGQLIFYRLVKNPDASKAAWKQLKLPHE